MRQLFEKHKIIKKNKKRKQLGEFHYYHSGYKILYGHIVNRRIKCEENSSRKDAD